jgi:hypothetical protein
MSFRRFALWMPLLLLPLFTGCSDDDNPTGPGTATYSWLDVTLEGMGPGSAMLAVDVNGDFGVALGIDLTQSKSPGFGQMIYSLDSFGEWMPNLTPGLPNDVIFLDVAVDASDSLVTVGYAESGANPARIFDARGPGSIGFNGPPPGMLTMAGDGSFYVAGGFSQGGQLWTSLTPGVWTQDVLPLTGTNDSGIRDVDVVGDMAVACGFDDGADTLQVLLQRTASTGWEKIPLGDGHFGRSFRCVALSEAGAIIVGGISGAGGPDPQPFVVVRSPAGDWVEIDLPNIAQVGMINDILIAEDAIYAVCSGEVNHNWAAIIRADALGVEHDIEPFQGQLFQLAEGQNGKVYATGVRRSGSGVTVETGIMLVRTPF